jgi:oligogalacturonide lyase
MPFYATFPSGKRLLIDPQTGREIWQLTNGDWVSHSPYPYCQAFSADQKYAVYSANRTGQYQLYRLEIEPGIACQLTDLADYQNFSLCVNPAGDEVFFTAGTQAWAANLETGDLRLITDYAPLMSAGGKLGRPCTSGDGRYILNYYQRPNGKFGLALADANGSRPEEIYMFEDCEAIGHLNYCPTDNNLVSYVPLPDRQNDFTLPPHERARAWRLDLQTGENSPLVIALPGFRATHEYWSPDGQRVFYHEKTHPGWLPTSINSVDRNGGDRQVHFNTNKIKLGHSSINRAGTHIVSDSQQPKENELVLIELATGTAEVLCYPNASGAPHPNHVHPSFSRYGDKIIYNSDFEHYAQIFGVACVNS